VRRSLRPSPLATIAGVVQRLSVLLAAGVTPAAAWEHLAAGTGSTVPRSVAGAANVPAMLLELSRSMAPLEGGAWRGLAVAWEVATEVGAPLAPSLRAYAGSLRSFAQTQRDAEVALAGPVATARMVMALPAVGILFSLVLGFDALTVLLGTPIGWGCLGVGGGLILTAARWNRSLVRAAAPRAATPGMECELLAIAMTGGGSLARAIDVVTAELARFELGADLARAFGILELSARAGVPAAELLRGEAAEARADARSAAQLDAARLSVRLMLPLGLCVLPAFMVLSVVPLLVSVISATAVSF
jgi:tight adherence protein B